MFSYLKKHSVYSLLFLFSIPLFFISIVDVHPWGDDYAQYIKEGQNIANGNSYDKTNYIYNELNTEYAPPSYPPGFPLLLAPVIKIWGISIRPILYLISFFMMALLFILFDYFKKFIPTTSAFCLSMIAVYSGAMIELKCHVLTDIPTTLFTSLYLLFRSSASFSKRRISGLIFTAFMAILIRPQALLLLAAEGVFFSIEIGKAVLYKTFSLKTVYQSLSFKIIVITVCLYFLVMNTIFNTGANQSMSHSLNLFKQYGDFWEMFCKNVDFLAELLRTFLHYTTTNLFLQTGVGIIESTCTVFALLGFFICLKKQYTFEIIFFTLMCCLILVFPIHQGIRYFLPVLPVYLIFIYEAAKKFIPLVFSAKGKTIALIFTACYLALGWNTFKSISYQADWTPYSQQDSVMFDYLRKNVKDYEVIVFSKPRALTLYTNKRTINYAWTASTQENKKKFDKVGVKYILTNKWLDDGSKRRFLDETAAKFDSLQMGNYKLYTLR